MTLVSNYTGPTQSGAAWSAVPRMALNMVTAALVAQSAEALRGLNYDKQNWQQVFSDTGNITVRLPDQSEFSGPSWKYLAENVVMKTNGVVPVTSGGTGAADKKNARINLELERFKQLQGETYIQANNPDVNLLIQDSGTWGIYRSDTKAWHALGIAQGGTGALTETGARSNLYVASAQYSFGVAQGWQTFSRTLSSTTLPTKPGVYYASSSTWAATEFGTVLVFSNGGDDALPSATGSWINILQLGNDGNIYYKMDINGSPTNWGKLYGSSNTTVDGNGNLKPASPIVKLYGDGTSAISYEAEGVVSERIDTGVYKVSGVLGFNSSPEWGGMDGGYVIPQNGNCLPLLWVDFKILPDGDLIIRTYHRAHSSAPEYARNLIGIKNDDGSFTETVKDGDPVDIPAGRWIDLRVEMPQNSIWNQKQKDMLEAMEKAEYERQQNQQDAQV
ncbi:phage tail protein [Citrobacter sp. CF971]|uniref:phage tail fiber protein n=1 Tax=Citrobacter sp. CF971 TaxID=2566012 RepID=UPI00352BB38B